MPALVLARRAVVATACVVFLCLGAARTSPAAVLTPISFLPGDTAPGPAAGNQTTPAIAAGDGGSLVVWADDRSSVTNSVTYPSGSGVDIYAARLDANGQLLDSTPILVAEDAADQTMPRVAWNGQDYLVAWSTQIPTASYFSYAVAAARVAPDGTVLDRPALLPVQLAVSSGLSFALAALGTTWAIAAEGDAAGESDVVGVRISGAGTVLDVPPVTLLPGTYFLRDQLELAGASDEFLLTWNELDDYRGLRLHADLSALDAASFDISGPLDAALGSRLAGNGSDFFLVWENATFTTLVDYVRGARIMHSGAVLDPGGIALTPNLGPITGRSPGAAWDGTRWWASYRKDAGTCVARVTTAGLVVDPAGIAVDAPHGATHDLAVLAPIAGGGVRVAWQDRRAGGDAPYDVYGTSVTGAGVAGAAACLSLGAPRQSLPSIARGAGGSMIAFASDVSGVRRIVAHPLDAAGNPTLAQPIELAVGPTLSGPSVAWNGACYLVTWSDDAGVVVYGRRLSPDGALLDAAPINVMRGSNPDLAAVGDVFLVAATFAPVNPQFRFVYARRVRGADGALLDPAAQTVGSSFAVRPRVAAYVDRWLVVYEGHPTHDDPHASVGCAIVGTDGAIGPEFGFLTPSTYNYLPDVAAQGDTALLVWQDPRVSNADWNLYARRILSSGAVLDAPGAPVSTAANNQGRVAVTWADGRFVTAFEDLREQSWLRDARSDVFAARFGADGSLVDPDGVAVFSDSLPEMQPAVAPAEAGGARVVATVFRDTAPYAALRVGMRVLDPAGTVAVEGVRPGFALAAAPNPLRAESAIRVTLPEAAWARVALYDVRGALVRELHRGVLPAGGSSFRWNGETAAGRRAAPGVYLLRLETRAARRELRIVRL